MKANELRIGNYVLDSYNGKITRINWQEIKWIQEVTDRYASIELTEEILLKCGFESDGLLYEFRSAKYVLKSDFEYVWIYDVELKSCICVKCKHLHQLQNLYFALTNKEIQFDL